MTREELLRLVRKSNSTTLVANRMRKALGLHEQWHCRHRGQSGARGKSKYINRKRYKHARKLVQQKHGLSCNNAKFKS